ncbi:unnamed protein product [Owenia fusiformis]|uniref:Fibronectin type-III domain-containing protein n=1 Tax=Owenia fusiformis TaxID=6347 RepID=A0A8S4Q5R7_OWEFU|nr:unnamed protein product [Owenia fusiformis]
MCEFFIVCSFLQNHSILERGPVEDIEIKDITETSFQVMWKRPIGTYIRLWIHHRQRGSAISQSISVPVNGVTVWTVTGFEPGRSYTVWMEIKYTISEGVEVSTNTSVLTSKIYDMLRR